jgi:predicted nuclease of predicted toxin-antitoxin system
MKFFLDENVDLHLVPFLEGLGHDVSSVRSRSLRGQPDDRLLEIATSEQRILLTHDRDFGELIFRRHMQHHGVILLRLKDDSVANIQNRLQHVLTHYTEDQFRHFIVVTQEDVRIRPGP